MELLSLDSSKRCLLHPAEAPIFRGSYLENWNWVGRCRSWQKAHFGIRVFNYFYTVLFLFSAMKTSAESHITFYNTEVYVTPQARFVVNFKNSFFRWQFYLALMMQQTFMRPTFNKNREMFFFQISLSCLNLFKTL